MEGTKNILLSKTVIGGLVAMVCAALGFWNVEVLATDQAELTQLLLTLGTVVGSLVSIVGRIVASKKVTVRVGKPPAGLGSLAVLALTAATLAGCTAYETYRAGGSVSDILDVAAQDLAVTCYTLDGDTVRVTVNGLADGFGQTELLEDVRAKRRAACTLIGAVDALADTFR